MDHARQALAVEARRLAVNAAKDQLRSRGLRPQHTSKRVIAAMAEEYLAHYRAKLIAAIQNPPRNTGENSN
jgi:hypothetical protein